MKIKQYYRRILRWRINYHNIKKLKNHDFSIISSNCVAGVIYHELHEKFNTPTINLYIKPSDYVKMCENLKYYMEEAELKEIILEECKYPVGMLDDIYIYFMHYNSFNEAKEKWEERKKRINWENLFLILVQRDNCTENIIRRFEKLPYKHKVIFTSKKRPDILSSFHIKEAVTDNNEVKDLCLYMNKVTGKRFIDKFPYVEFLNMK